MFYLTKNGDGFFVRDGTADANSNASIVSFSLNYTLFSLDELELGTTGVSGIAENSLVPHVSLDKTRGIDRVRLNNLLISNIGEHDGVIGFGIIDENNNTVYLIKDVTLKPQNSIAFDVEGGVSQFPLAVSAAGTSESGGNDGNGNGNTGGLTLTKKKFASITLGATSNNNITYPDPPIWSKESDSVNIEVAQNTVPAVGWHSNSWPDGTIGIAIRYINTADSVVLTEFFMPTNTPSGTSTTQEGVYFNHELEASVWMKAELRQIRRLTVQENSLPRATPYVFKYLTAGTVGNRTATTVELLWVSLT